MHWSPAHVRDPWPLPTTALTHSRNPRANDPMSFNSLPIATSRSGSMYRADIDGLRALAVLPVVMFHAGLGFPGGFVGVDVFFVISGYLITSLLAGEIIEEKFSILRFYERRIRRIFPALFTMLAVTTVAAWLLFMPPELELFGHSMTMAAVFASNISFWSEAGYFDPVARFKPLLHTWSLGVEEQFYILFPLLLAALCRFMPQRRVLIVTLLTVSSFILSVIWIRSAPDSAFFLLPSRFWELGVGSLLALAPPFFIRQSLPAAGLCTVGLTLIGAAIFGISEDTPFPGVTALLPCLGAVLVIMAGTTRNAVSGLLGSRLLVLIGLISYSLYLWHWPIIILAQYRLGRLLDVEHALLVVAASFAVAMASWRFIEQPVRQRAVLGGRPMLFAGAAAVAGVTVTVGLAMQVSDGLPSRLPLQVQKIYAGKQDRSPFLQSSCLVDADAKKVNHEWIRHGKLCAMGSDSASPPNFLVWGDSHAAALAPAIDSAGARFHQRGLFAGRSACPPLIDYDIKSSNSAKRQACRNQNNAVIDLVKRRHIPLVFLVARWPREVLGAQNGEEGPFYDPTVPYSIVDRSNQVTFALDSTIRALTALGVRAVLVMDVPEPGYDVPVSLARAALSQSNARVNPARKAVDARQYLAKRVLEQAAARWGVPIVDPTPVFCDKDLCHAEVEGVSRYLDADHITRSAALGLTHLFDDSFATQGSVQTRAN